MIGWKFFMAVSFLCVTSLGVGHSKTRTQEKFFWRASYHHGGTSTITLLVAGEDVTVNGALLKEAETLLWAADLSLVRSLLIETTEATGCGAGSFELVRDGEKARRGCLESFKGKRLASAFRRLAAYTR